MLYSLMKNVTWNLVNSGLLSYTRKTKHKPRSSWALHHHIYHTKIVFHVMVVEGQIVSLRIQTHLLLLNWDSGHHERFTYLCGNCCSLAAEHGSLEQVGSAPLAEQIVVSIPCTFL